MYSRNLILKSTTFIPSRTVFNVATKLTKEPKFDNSFITHPTFQHPKEEKAELESISFDHRVPITVSDKIASGAIQTFRSCFDFFTGYKHPTKGVSYEGTRFEMTESKWLTRCIFLESVAGIPGMTAAFIRHLHSLRLLKRDKAWIETLLDEAYNERIHLLTFINLGKPSWFTRFFIFMGQGVFCNIFFFNYLFFPKFCHRFVGYLEEEAVSTYSHFIKELDAGKLKKFDDMAIPPVAIQYYGTLDEKSTIRDLILCVRADEAKHREVNHTFANLSQKTDRNPYALVMGEEQPSNDLKYHHPTGWERKDIIMK
ncbi:inducible alternative oxidase 2 [Yamadazyma tenuis]|uniref:Alternative oxidase n=1 Tax=Candida tenuis (strain ATCC 10573 / BCRC 21748 / CBS 615 / JCM 9827 / NBRC 10315 / NRRL Y-1498 / VKM Y-70) TaxID=590646 RepID=G3B122_CANTC|nr:uncharacterized protein CANTEDRAFT_104081 [Yamadazyma tenuis ATCC 10573]EGV64861.1 hypothetical protein CANTEDRAFT_104081 [Yamadazyma tenuis ATCC 10573]WEJ97657.1 inducible alternative oxidase 2 [Yamadazyma tenuis]